MTEPYTGKVRNKTGDENKKTEVEDKGFRDEQFNSINYDYYLWLACCYCISGCV
jgi:hypothetical protein